MMENFPVVITKTDFILFYSYNRFQNYYEYLNFLLFLGFLIDLVLEFQKHHTSCLRKNETLRVIPLNSPVIHSILSKIPVHNFLLFEKYYAMLEKLSRCDGYVNREKMKVYRMEKEKNHLLFDINEKIFTDIFLS